MSERTGMCVCAVALAMMAGVAAAQERAAEAPALPPAFVRAVKVAADKAPDCSSLARIVETVTRGARTNDEKAIALYNFMRLAHYHRAYPNEPGGIGALKLINVYGWALCGGLHTVQAALWRQMGWPWRYVGWSNPGHTTAEAQYDGRWHYLDTFLKVYVWMPEAGAPGGRTLAGEDDLKANPALVTEGLVFDKARKVYYHKDSVFQVIGGKANWTAPAFLVCGDDVPGIVSGVNSRKGAGSPTGWGAIKFDEPGYSTDVNLAPGYSLTLTWDAVEGAHWFNGRKEIPKHTCGDKDYRNSPDIGPILEPYAKSGGATRTFASGTLLLAPDFSDPACMASLAGVENAKAAGGAVVPAEAGRPASITVLLASPYIMSRARGEAEGGREGRDLDRRRQNVQGHRPGGLLGCGRRQVPGPRAPDVPGGPQAAEAGGDRAAQPLRPALPFARQEPHHGLRGRRPGPRRQQTRRHVRLPPGQPQQVLRATVRGRGRGRPGALCGVVRCAGRRAEDVYSEGPARHVRDRRANAQGQVPGVSSDAPAAARGDPRFGQAPAAAGRRGRAKNRPRRGFEDPAEPVSHRHRCAAGGARGNSLGNS